MFNNPSANKVTLGLLSVFLIASTAFIASVIDHANDHGYVIPSPAQIDGECTNGVRCDPSQPVKRTSAEVNLVPQQATQDAITDAALLNTSYHGNDLTEFANRDENGRNAGIIPLSIQKHVSFIRKVAGALIPGAGASKYLLNKSVNYGSHHSTGSSPSSSKLRFEQKLLKLGPIGGPIVYDRNNLPPALERLAPGIFRGVPHKFLPEYKEPCWRKGNGDLRCLPYFFIGGFPKCATTDLWGKLTSHPDIMITLKEPHWWTRTAGTGRAFEGYLKHQTKVIRLNAEQGRKDLINCDASALTFQENYKHIERMPATLKKSLKYLTADIIRVVLPDTKIVGIVRNPTERAYSAFLYFGGKEHNSPKDFHEQISRSIKEFYRCTDERSLQQCAYQKFKPHINSGCYSLYIREYLNRFPREQFFFLRSEDWSRDPVHYMKEIYTFLQLDPLTDAERTRTVNSSKRLNMLNKAKRVGPMLPETRKLLDDFYRPCNEDLARILQDEKYLWNS